jgi:hypothetical protein
LQPGERGYEDHSAVPASGHLRQEGAGEQHAGPAVQVDGGGQFARRAVEKPTGRRDRRVGDHQADRRASGYRRDLVERGWSGEVSRHRAHLDSVRAPQPFRGELQRLRPARHQDKVHAAAGDLIGERGADTLGAAGHDRPRPVRLRERKPAHVAARASGAGPAAGAGSVNECSRAIRIGVPSGSSSHGRFRARTKPKCGDLCTPEYSSDKMISTTTDILPHLERRFSRMNDPFISL